MLTSWWKVPFMTCTIVATVAACASTTSRSRDDDGAFGGGGSVGTTSANTNAGTGGAGMGGSATGGAGTGGAATGGGGTGGSGGDAPCDNGQCTYPSGPYGVAVGDTLPPTLMWQGLPAGSATVGSVAVDDNFDCDGSCGIQTILFITTQFGSDTDAAAATWVHDNWASLQAMGTEVVFLLLDNPNEGPPTAAGAAQWRATYSLDNAAVVADPSFSMVVGGSVGTPMTTYVDAATMLVTNKVDGFNGQL